MIESALDYRNPFGGKAAKRHKEHRGRILDKSASIESNSREQLHLPANANLFSLKPPQASTVAARGTSEFNEGVSKGRGSPATSVRDVT